MKDIPTEITKLVNLTSLDLSKNKLASLPDEVLQLTTLRMLNIKDNQLTSLPQLCILPYLTSVKANRNYLDLGRLPPGW